MRHLTSTFALFTLCSTLAIGQQRGAPPSAGPGPAATAAPAAP
ncbi:MAG: hypothetical protein JWL71_1703, partial [Acidobacteria bacterium]|nr:hypothetical protein [Acidobacteriota bacterium]